MRYTGNIDKPINPNYTWTQDSGQSHKPKHVLEQKGHINEKRLSGSDDISIFVKENTLKDKYIELWWETRKKDSKKEMVLSALQNVG